MEKHQKAGAPGGVRNSMLKKSNQGSKGSSDSKAGREKGEAIKKLMLEHELELETLRQELERSEKVLDYQRQVSSLKSRLHENEGNIADLTEKLNNLQGIHEEKLLTEKEKIVHILEAGFVQREKLAIQQVESALEIKYTKEMEDAVTKHQSTREREKEKIR